jgi:hypothetical protein
MRAIILIFLVVYLLNLIPAFAPPTWMVFSFIGFHNAPVNVTALALTGGLAATLGRMTLAKMSRSIIRQRFLSDRTRQNIDAIREGIQSRRKATFGAFLFYAFSPLPSNYLFIAYGLTTLELKLIAIPFFIGRSVSYAFWGHASSAMARQISLESSEAMPYLGVYFVVSQILLLSLVYVFTRIDWRALFVQKKLKWMAGNPQAQGRR